MYYSSAKSDGDKLEVLEPKRVSNSSFTCEPNFVGQSHFAASIIALERHCEKVFFE